jgi:O-antigen ligase
VNPVQHIRENLKFYLLLLSWVIVGQFAPNIVAVGYAVVTFIAIVASNNVTKILLAFLTMLILSDSRIPMMSFAATAKIAATVILVVYVLRNMKDMKNSDNQIFKFFLPFLLFGVLASFWSPNIMTAFQKSMSYSFIYFAIPLTYLSADEQNENLSKDLINWLTVILGVGLIMYVVNPDFATLVGRYRGLLGNPNGMGILLTVTAPLYLLLKQRDPELFQNKWREYLFLGIFILSLILTGSRTSLFAILMFIGFIRLRFLSNSVTLIVFLILIVGYEFLLNSLPLIAQSLGIEEYLRLDTLEEGSGRFIAWNFAWEQIQDVFFAGGGFGYTEKVFNDHFSYLSILGHQGNSHNSYLTLWLDTGIIGLLLLIISLIRSIIRGLQTSVYVLPVLYCVLFSANFESWYAASLNPFTSIFLISLTMLLVDRKEAEKIAEGSTEGDFAEAN